MAHTKAQIRAYNQKQYQANPDKRRKHSRDWYWNNRDKYRAAQLKRKYGLDLERFNQLFVAQGSCCAICKKTDAKQWCVDHDHTTHQIRGILCFRCNTSLGQLEDNVLLLSAAISYLQRGC